MAASIAAEWAPAIAIFVSATFAWSAVGKLRRFRTFIYGIGQYDLLPKWANLPVAFLILTVEGALAVLHLLPSLWHVAGAVGVAMTLFLFGTVATALRRGAEHACYCDGSDAEQLSRWTLVRLAVLLACDSFIATSALTSPSRAASLWQSVGEQPIPVVTNVLAVTICVYWLLQSPSVATLFRRRFSS